MKHVARFVAAAATLVPFAVLAQSTPPQSEPPQQKGATFESLDTDSDGRISKTEAEGNATVKAQFSMYDVNGDGFIERAEVTQANKSQSESPQQ